MIAYRLLVIPEGGSSQLEQWVEQIPSIRQRWIGFPAPVLREVENLAIIAMVCVSGLFGNTSTDSDVQGALLHCGKEALKVKNSVQTAYREGSQSEEPATWESVSEGLLQRALLLLEFGNTKGAVPELLAPVGSQAMLPVIVSACSERLLLIPQEDEDGIGHLPEEVIVWQQTNAEVDQRCLAINSARKFLIEGPKADHVREVLAARRVSLHDAECGYSGALSLVEAGILDDDTVSTCSQATCLPFACELWAESERLLAKTGLAALPDHCDGTSGRYFIRDMALNTGGRCACEDAAAGSAAAAWWTRPAWPAWSAWARSRGGGAASRCSDLGGRCG